MWTRSQDDVEALGDELREPAECASFSLQLELPRLIGPALEQLLDAIERDDPDAGEAPFAELLDQLDTPPRRAELARAVIAPCARRTDSPQTWRRCALIDWPRARALAVARGLLEAAAVARRGRAHAGGGLVLAA